MYTIYFGMRPSSGIHCCIRRGGLIINVPSPARTLRSVAEREQLGVMVRGKWLNNTFGAMKKKTVLIDSSEYM